MPSHQRHTHTESLCARQGPIQPRLNAPHANRGFLTRLASGGCISGNPMPNLRDSAPPVPEVVVLSSYRAARLHHIESSGREVFMDHEGQLCCEHGERGRALSRWLTREKEDCLAVAEGRCVKPFRRDSVCNCRTTDGLFATPQLQAPSPPQSLYAYLQDMDAPFVFSHHLPAVELPFHPGIYLRVDGKLACRHGNTKRSIKAGRCDCAVPVLPKRQGCLPMGMHCPKKRVRVAL